MLLRFTISHAAEAVAVVVGPAAVDLTGVTSAVDIGGSDAEHLAVCSHVIPSCTGYSRTVSTCSTLLASWCVRSLVTTST